MKIETTRRAVLGAAIGAGFAVRAEAADRSLRVGLSAPNTTMDPHLQSNAPNNAVASHIFDALITNDPQSRAMPGLAESWRVEGDTRWVLKLRQGVKFTDGTPFTAADAIASLQRATDLPSTASFRTYTRSIQAMAAPDPYTLVLDTKGPDPMLANSLSRIRIISAKFKDAMSPDFNAGRAAIGTGAFSLREYIPGSHVTLVRNDAWWGPRLPWSEVTLRIVTDPGARLASLLAGDLDFIEDVPAQGADRVKTDPKLHLISGISSRLIYFAMDHAREVSPFVTSADGKPITPNPLRDLRVRQALNMAINRQALAERVMEGNAVVANQFLPNGAPGTAPDLGPIPYDPARAKALLAEAGFPQGFRLTLHGPNNRYINDSKVVQSVAQMFNRIGVETKVDVMPWSVFAGRSAAREFSMFLIGWGVNTGETSNPLSALIATPDRPAGMGIANEMGYSNPEVDRILKQALRTMDEPARNALLAQACSLAFKDVAIVPVHHEVSVWGGATVAELCDPSRPIHLGDGDRRSGMTKRPVAGSF